ncbi:sensor domain-containing diguanylate cyclase [Aquibacillus sediminis]|uniref:sensor domain-containing diguanylate cyclase n=1 Tax=Aquibacillus sediminis TaxID=2574734 RepID=UPI0014871366|nr:sensor domain-containing diguanylate cyclase [Aquibacillus sediminis]
MLNGWRLMVLVFITFMLGVTLTSYLLVGYVDLVALFFCFLILPIIWWIGREHDHVRKDRNTLQHSYQELQQQYKTTKIEKQTIEKIIDTVDDIAIFSINESENTAYFSKAVEQIFGLPHEAFISEPNLWKQFIHPDDKEKINKQFSNITEPLQAEFRIIRLDEEIRWVVLRIVSVEKNAIEGNIIDITDRKELEDKLKQFAYYDDLTDLPNRKLMERQLKKSIARSKRNDHSLCVMFIDLDGFKKVNDTLGHEAGDELLKEVALRLDDTVREGDLIARHGGDEFIAIFEETDKTEVEGIADRIIDELSHPYSHNEKESTITPSIGISLYPDHGEEMDSLIKYADKAMYYAKSKGKANYQFYSSELPDAQIKKENVLEKIVNHFTK